MRNWWNITTVTGSKGTEQILKAVFKFVFAKMTQPRRRRLILIPLGLWLLNMLFSRSQINFKNFDLKTAKINFSNNVLHQNNLKKKKIKIQNFHRKKSIKN